MTTQVVISGCGWVTPLAVGDIGAVLKAYSVRGNTAHSQGGYEPVGDVLGPFTNLPGEAAKEGAVKLAAVALELAWKNSELNADTYPSHRKGLILGCALAGATGMIDFANDVREQSARFVSPIRFPQTVGNYVCGALARGYDFRGPASTIACGCASSIEAVREGAALLAGDAADVVLAGGSEKLSDDLVTGLNEPQVRFADGACFFVLERADSAAERGVKPIGWIRHESTPSGVAPPATELVSTAGFASEGAIYIEHWVGGSLGSAGAAALAAAIGATKGFPVPLGGEQTKPPAFQSASKYLRVVAKGLGGYRSVLRVAIG